MQFWMFQVNSAHIRYNAIPVLKALDVFRLANIFFRFADELNSAVHSSMNTCIFHLKWLRQKIFLKNMH